MTLTDHPGFDLAPVAEGTGPFCTQAFLDTAARFEEGTPLLAASETAFLPFRRVGDDIRFIGDPEVTDYHTPRGEGSEDLVASIAEDAGSVRFVLDSLPEEAAKPLAAGLSAAGMDVSTRVHEVAAVLHLPATVDEYLASIGKKERHEVRRKRRRFEAMVGDVDHVVVSGAGWALDEFLRLHRLAAGEKGRFMTQERAALFTELAQIEGWRFDLLRVGDRRAVAIMFGYVDPTGYYLYNSGYDPEASDASPGVVLLSVMIESAIEEGVGSFDFLKGDEAYKFRLGAERRPLIEIVAREAS